MHKNSPITLDDALHTRRSVREFQKKLVPDDLVEELMNSARLAPTSCNMQLYYFIVVNDKQLLEKMAKHVTGKVNWCRQLSILVVDNRITYENHANYISAGMVVENFMLKAVELGLATCPIAGFHGKDYLKELLNIPSVYDIPLLIFFGYEKDLDTQHHVPYRVPVEHTYSYNKYEGDVVFPTTNNIDCWSQYEINEYRKRITSVYYTRFGHKVWGDGFNSPVWEKLTHLIQSGPSLYVFPWEKDLIENLGNKIKPYKLDLLDYNKELLDFTKQSMEDIVGNNYLIENEIPEKKYMNIVLSGNIIFQKDLDELFHCMRKSLAPAGKIFVVRHRVLSFTSLVHKLLYFLKIRNDVYHKSLFYKVGPFQFYSKRTLLHSMRKYGLRIDRTSKVKTHYLSSIKGRKSVLGKTLSYLEGIFAETVIDEVVIDDM